MNISYPNILLDGLENGVIILDEDLSVYYWNLWMEINTGIKANDIMGNNLKDYFYEIDYEVLLRKIKTSLRLKSATFYSASGNKKFMTIKRPKVTSSSVNTMKLKVSISPYIVEEKKVMISIYDVSEMQEIRLSLQHEIEHSKIINEMLERDKNIINNNLMILKLDTDCKIIESTSAFCDFFKLTEDELLGRTPSELCDLSNMSSIQDDILKVVKNKKTWRGEVHSSEIDGTQYWLDAIITPYIDEDNEVISITAIYHDISDKKRIEELSITDHLTKLYNRLKFNHVIDELILNHRKTDKVSTIILMDIDYFKNVNDTYGHQKGDEVLIEIAGILKTSIRKSDLAARWGGEEFVLLLPEVDAKIGEKVAEKIRVNIESHKFEDIGKITCSFGLTQHISGDTKEDILHRADKALYKAKDSGRNTICTMLNSTLYCLS